MTAVIIAVGALTVAAAVVAVVAAFRPTGSDGAPGEVVADRPLSEPTPAGWDDRDEAGGAEDRPAGPGAEPMAPDRLGGQH